jgi:AbrB family looped-hinge helix DNA binding protein
MRSTIDKAGRLVIPKPLRDRLGLVAGEVEVTADGAALRVEPVAREDVVRKGRWTIVPLTGDEIGDELVRSLRDADQR